MAFHVACPITCRRICHCSLGFPRTLRRDDFLLEVSALEEFLTDPWGIRVSEVSGTVQVAVPKVEPPPLPPPPPAAVVDAFGASDGGDDALAAVSAQAKRVALQKKAAAAMEAAEDYARRFESGDLLDQSGDLVEEQGLSNSKILCRMCLFGESEGSERAKKMLPCKTCGKKYHRSCLKNWSQNRDLFHWSSWTCPSCRMCEICRRTGDPKKFMFCKRCDGAHHCYCQHPPHKNVSSGPYLCPKHTKCHSCASSVPGNGLSVRWFLGYTCCDACGRLFVKGNYCPVCLKVYRDSEATPMVCCDLCQRWVHTDCDGISDEKYHQFQVDDNLQYVCATCRGESYQVKDLEDAVQELWRRKDTADRDLIASLRAAAGLPTQEEIFYISPYSDDDENGPAVVKSDSGRQLKLSFKGLIDKSPTKAKDGKKSSKKKKSKKNERHASSMEPESSTVILIDDGKNETRLLQSDQVSSSFDGHIDPSEGIPIRSVNQPAVLKHKLIDDISRDAEDKKSRVVHIKSNKPTNADGVDTGKPKNVNEKKLVIHLGGRNKSAATPHSDGSSCQKEHDLLIPNGNGDITEQRANDKSIVDKHEDAGVGSSRKSEVVNSAAKEGNIIKLGKVRSEASNVNPRPGKGTADVETNTPDQRRLVFRKRSTEGMPASSDPPPPIQTYSRGKSSLGKQIRKPDVDSEINNDHDAGPTLEPPKDSKPLLKLKFKNINRENQPSLLPLRDEEKSSIKGQRSKRKRPSPLGGKTSSDGEEDGNRGHQDNLLDEIMDANWILKKLGKDAIGKRVEVQQPSDNSWHKGVVTDIVEGTSMLSVDLDDGRMKSLELGKQGVRFVSQKQKRSKT